MAAYDFSAPRLFLDADLSADAPVELAREQANYLLAVLRRETGDDVLVFNGRDGEWRAAIERSGRKAAAVVPREQVRTQTPLPDVVYLFAPLKHARLDYMVQKAVEMGAGRLRPILTRRTVATRINRDRMVANVVEAAEQCGILALPSVEPERSLADAVAALEPERILVFCDEDAPVANPLRALSDLRPGAPVAVAIGPEGGFDETERAFLLARPGVRRLSLGPRILRADTAAVAALAIVGAALAEPLPRS